MGMCVVPFLPGDAIKIVAASLLAWPVRKAIYR
jgi:biotin transporter BioY